MHVPGHAHVWCHVHLVADRYHARLHGGIAQTHHVVLHPCSMDKTHQPWYRKLKL